MSLGSPEVRWGYVLPSSGDTAPPDPAVLWEIASVCDASILDHLWVSDHVLWWHPMYESVSLLAALAARTSRVRLGPAVLQLAMRNPVIVAKELATIARLSGERLTVGVGVGGEFAPEWEAVGQPRRGRGRRTDEMIQSLRGMWAQQDFGMSGRHVSFDPLTLEPRLSRPPPIWIGGRTDAALARAARYGDGWMGIWLTPERYAERLSFLRNQIELEGRESIVPSLYVWTCIDDTTAKAREKAADLLGSFYNLPFEKLERFAVIGSVQDCAERFSEFVDAGVRDFAVAPIEREASTAPLQRLLSLVGVS